MAEREFDDFEALISAERALVEISVAYLKVHYPGALFEGLTITNDFRHIVRATKPGTGVTVEVDLGAFGLDQKSRTAQSQEGGEN